MPATAAATARKSSGRREKRLHATRHGASPAAGRSAATPSASMSPLLLPRWSEAPTGPQQTAGAAKVQAKEREEDSREVSPAGDGEIAWLPGRIELRLEEGQP